MPDQLIDTFRTRGAEIDRLLDQMDEESDVPDENLRRHQRSVFRTRAVVCFAAAGSRDVSVPHVVATRNISQGGMAFLHWGFVHPGSRCAITVRSSEEKTRTLHGVVVRCTLVDGTTHEVAVQFDPPR